MLSFDELETIKAVARTGSFSAAGRELYLTQPAISQRVKHIEQALGIEVFERNPDSRRLSLTNEGAEVLEFASITLVSFADLRTRLAQKSERPERLVTIGCAGLYASSYILPPLLHECFSRIHPFPIRLQWFPFSELGDRLRGREIDVCIQAATDAMPDMAITPLLHDRWVLTTSPDHPIVRSWTEKTKKIELPVLVPPPQAEVRRLLDNWSRVHDIPLTVSLECGSVDALKAAAVHGLGVALLPELAIFEELRTGALLNLPHCGLPFERSIIMAHDPKRPLPQSLSDLVQTAKDRHWLRSLRGISISPHPQDKCPHEAA